MRYNDSSDASNLKSNLEVEYYRWFFGTNGSDGFHYRFDPLTGEMYRSDETTFEIRYNTYYICWSEYPVYNAYGKYIGLYFSGIFIKPISRSEMSHMYNVKSLEVDPFDL